jgi:hypothetical protein
LKTDVNGPTVSNKQKSLEKNKLIFVGILKATEEQKKEQETDQDPDP